VNWGTGVVDFDHDGDRDIYVANGHTEDNVDLYDSSTAYRVQNTLLMNTGNGDFENISNECGDGLQPVHASRGTGFNDLDNDGDVDIVVLNSRQRPSIIRNDCHALAAAKERHWVAFELIGKRSNRDGVGSRVTIEAGKRRQIAELHSGRGYQSHYAMRLHFGVDEQEKIDRLQIRWAGSGTVDVFTDLQVDRLHRIVEGSGE
jgi:hypothetical protein